MLSKTDFVKGNFNILRRLREPFSIRMIPLSAGSWRQAESTVLLNVRFKRSRAQDQGYADLREWRPVVIAHYLTKSFLMSYHNPLQGKSDRQTF
jgi:hypothetical protein